MLMYISIGALLLGAAALFVAFVFYVKKENVFCGITLSLTGGFLFMLGIIELALLLAGFYDSNFWKTDLGLLKFVVALFEAILVIAGSFLFTLLFDLKRRGMKLIQIRQKTKKGDA